MRGHKKHHLHTHNREKEGEKEGVSLSLHLSIAPDVLLHNKSFSLLFWHYCGPLLPLPFLLIQRPTSKGNPPPPPIAPRISSAESPPDMQCSLRRRRRGQSGGNCCGAITTCSRTAVEGGCCIRKGLEFNKFPQILPKQTYQEEYDFFFSYKNNLRTIFELGKVLPRLPVPLPQQDRRMGRQNHVWPIETSTPPNFTLDSPPPILQTRSPLGS